MSKTIIVKKKTVQKGRVYRKWTETEIDYLKTNYRKSSSYSLAKKLDRPVSSVSLKAKSLGLMKEGQVTPQVITSVVPLKKSVNGIPWTKQEVKFLKDNYGKMTLEAIAKELGRTRGAVSGKIFSVKNPSSNKIEITNTFKITNSNKPWTSEELEYLEKNYNRKPCKFIAKRLKRSLASVNSKASKLRQYKEGSKSTSISVVNTKSVAPTPNAKSSFSAWVLGTLVALNILTLSTIAYLVFIH